MGKTTFIKNLLGEANLEDNTSTTKTHSYPITVLTGIGPVKFILWDTVGQVDLCGLSIKAMRNAHCAILVYDIMKKSTAAQFPQWRHTLTRAGNRNIPILVAANKVDLLPKDKPAPDELFSRCKQLGTSAKKKLNTSEALRWIAHELMDSRFDIVNMPFPEHDELSGALGVMDIASDDRAVKEGEVKRDDDGKVESAEEVKRDDDGEVESAEVESDDDDDDDL